MSVLMLCGIKAGQALKVKTICENAISDNCDADGSSPNSDKELQANSSDDVVTKHGERPEEPKFTNKSGKKLYIKTTF